MEQSGGSGLFGIAAEPFGQSYGVIARLQNVCQCGFHIGLFEVIFNVFFQRQAVKMRYINCHVAFLFCELKLTLLYI